MATAPRKGAQGPAGRIRAASAFLPASPPQLLGLSGKWVKEAKGQILCLVHGPENPPNPA